MKDYKNHVEKKEMKEWGGECIYSESDMLYLLKTLLLIYSYDFQSVVLDSQHQHQHHLRACVKCEFLSPIPVLVN